MSASGYRISPKANRDLETIWRYTHDTWSPDQANKYYNQLIDAIEHLAARRLKGRQIRRIRRGYLVFAHESHFIVFTQRANVMVVVRILHRRMNISAHL